MPKNWRPISLLNTDYKIASKAITERLKPVMCCIVHCDQSCSVVGRSIFSNLLLIRDTLDMISKTDKSGILVTLDQEKAFDRVDHAFLMRVLSNFGFGPSFCQWVSLFYNNVFLRIICNGSLSPPLFFWEGVLGRVVPSPPFFTCWFLKFCLPKFENVQTLLVFSSLVLLAYNLTAIKAR